jgi:hypothetical protein
MTERKNDILKMKLRSSQDSAALHAWVKRWFTSILKRFQDLSQRDENIILSYLLLTSFKYEKHEPPNVWEFYSCSSSLWILRQKARKSRALSNGKEIDDQ